MMIPVLIAASTLFHQVLVVERKEPDPLLETRFLTNAEASDFAKELAKEGAHVVSAPSLLAQSEGEALLEVASDDNEMRLHLRSVDGNANLHFRLRDKDTRLEARAHLAAREGAIFVVPIDAAHLLIGRSTGIADGAAPDDASRTWRKTWQPLLAP